ncbi:hypothetical protein [Ruegeria faecimaris]|uniref:hypothetical protein n=1 Tax=Ruegeria faecimaris TaxID=686389 RepID=UPI00232E1CB7|nr:hypothetical protein [Ruegeria faecimaris]
MREAISISLLLLLLGCASPSSENEVVEAFFPFADRPTEQVTLQHDVQIVKGSVFHFEQDGSRVIYHFAPVATTLDRNTYVVSVSSVLDIADFMSGDFDAESDVRAVIAAAQAYCEQTGYIRQGSDAIIWVGENSSSLVEFCIPKGIELPSFYKAGDRVPRGQ